MSKLSLGVNWKYHFAMCQITENIDNIPLSLYNYIELRADDKQINYYIYHFLKPHLANHIWKYKSYLEIFVWKIICITWRKFMLWIPY